jgi:hypothetical protein
VEFHELNIITTIIIILPSTLPELLYAQVNFSSFVSAAAAEI